ncbi:MAG: hypothetical protein MUC87_21760 [Bacteroidia bacterium]|jgi:hypothetical protein|nr:hypothetical protein [Bacteroidia bacterium]
MLIENPLIHTLLKNGIQKFPYHGTNSHFKAVYKKNKSSVRYLLQDGPNLTIIQNNVGKGMFTRVGDLETKFILIYLNQSPSSFKQIFGFDSFDPDQMLRKYSSLQNMLRDSYIRKLNSKAYLKHIDRIKTNLAFIDTLTVQ